MAGFVVLVSGTLVYGKGDEEGLRLELEEAMVAQAAVEPIATEEWRAPGEFKGPCLFVWLVGWLVGWLVALQTGGSQNN